MLGRRVLQALLLVTAYIVVTPAAAHADYIYCPPDNGPCVLRAGSPGGGGGGGGGGSGGGSGSGAALCNHETGFIPCYRPGMGWYNHRVGCYYERLDLGVNDPRWGTNDPSRGFVYAVWCWGGASAGWQITSFNYLTSSPPGWGGQPTPISLALQAINMLPMEEPRIGLVPNPAGAGLVGLPVWMWTYDPAVTWIGDPARISATAAAAGVSVTAWAYSSRIVWDMGDGTIITCWNPGNAWNTSNRDTASPSCGHLYERSSRGLSGGVYNITATTIWDVHWEGGGRIGDLTIYRTSSSQLRIEELQVVNK